MWHSHILANVAIFIQCTQIAYRFITESYYFHPLLDIHQHKQGRGRQGVRPSEICGGWENRDHIRHDDDGDGDGVWLWTDNAGWWRNGNTIGDLILALLNSADAFR